MPPKEPKTYKFGYINPETGEFSELKTMSEPMGTDSPEEGTDYFAQTTFSGEIELVGGVWTLERAVELYRNNNDRKIHGKRTIRWRTLMRTILSAQKKCH